jgi:hypothetical protein
MEIVSRDLAKNLEDCQEVFLFAATLGMGPDRLIRRASAGRMSDAVIYQALSAEMIESSYNKNVITVICIQDEDGTGFTFDESRKRSWKAVEKMAQKHGAYTFKSLDLVALFLNKLQAVADYSLTETTVIEEDVYPSNGFDITTTLQCIYNCLY